MATGKNINDSALQKVTDFTNVLNRLYASATSSTKDGYIIIIELINHIISSVTKSDVGLSNADNTSDVDKPISTATQSALDLKLEYNTAASGLPSTTGAGNINMTRANDYYSESPITGDVTWGLTNIVVDKAVSIDVKANGNAINLVQAGITFKGAVIAGVVQGLDASESNLIAIWAQTATIMWVTVILNEV